MLFTSLKILYNPGGHPGHAHHRRHVFCDNGSGSYMRFCSDGFSRQNYCGGSDHGTATDSYIFRSPGSGDIVILYRIFMRTCDSTVILEPAAPNISASWPIHTLSPSSSSKSPIIFGENICTFLPTLAPHHRSIRAFSP